MKVLILILLSFTAIADNNIELTGDLDITGTNQTAATAITYDLEGNAVQICIGLTLNGGTGGGGGGGNTDWQTLRVKVRDASSSSGAVGDDFSVGTEDDSRYDIPNNGIILDPQPNANNAYGTNVFHTGLTKTLDESKTYTFSFTRQQITRPASSYGEDVSSNAAFYMFGMFAGIVFNEPTIDLSNPSNSLSNFRGYGINTSEELVAIKINRDNTTKIGTISTSGGIIKDNTAVTVTNNDDVPYEIILSFNGTNWVAEFTIDGTTVKTITTNAVTGDLVQATPYFHSDIISTNSSVSEERFKDIDFTEALTPTPITVTITSPDDPTYPSGSEFFVTAIFSEAVTGIDALDLNVGDDVEVTNFSAVSTTEYLFTLDDSGLAPDPLEITLIADAANEGNEASNTLELIPE
jgi:hypothetical protein